MTIPKSWTLAAVVVLLFPAEPGSGQQRRLTDADYARAEQFLPRNFASLVRNEAIDARWIGDSDRFWYRRQLTKGHEFVLVDARMNRSAVAFDHGAVARALSDATGKTYDATALPLDNLLPGEKGEITFTTAGERWACGSAGAGCRRLPAAGPAPKPDELPSPDRRWRAVVRDHDLYVRATADGTEIRLTTDGEPDHDYATRPDAGQSPIRDRRSGVKRPPPAVWSPDSKRLITHRMDQRNVTEQVLVQAAPAGGSVAVFHRYRAPNPGDSIVPRGKLLIFDIATRQAVPVSLDPLVATYFTAIDFGQVWWSADSERAFVLAEDRGWKAVRMFEVDARTGKPRLMVEEASQTFVELSVDWGARGSHNVRALGNGAEIVWFSERDGWGHLYLYDGATGSLKGQITKGPWLVRQILRIDEENQQIYFTGAGREPGRDPYYRHLYRVNFDGSRLSLLTPEDADHEIQLSPSGRYFVDSYSRVDTVPAAVLRSIDGKLIRKLEEGDVSKLLATGWRWPERFTVKARDGSTDLYGLLFRPTSFDSTRRYPVIDDYYPGGQTIRTPKRFGAGLGASQSTAELGFVVVTLDGMGTALRSKAFHDVSYKNVGDATLPDHVGGLQQLARRYPYLDLERVGIHGSSAGGYGSVRAILAYPDFFKVAVSTSGNATPRNVLAMWSEKWFGYPVGAYYDEHDNRKLVGNLKGKLLLGWGDMDDTVLPYQSQQLVDALIRANKDFDLVVMANQEHGMGGTPYFTRKRWDYFVEHLLGAVPPQGYTIKAF